jgi:hypothetical protein
MSAPSSMQGRQPAMGGARTEQIYFTHCLPGYSWRNEAGYGIRASSTDDSTLLDFAARFTAYELPLDMWGDSPTPADTPRRLALVQVSSGLSALVHTSYLTEDTRGRKHSYFSHFLFRATITAEQALESWASIDWTPDYPRQADKHLQDFPGGLPRHGPLVEQALTAFLNGEPPAHGQTPATVYGPSRLSNDRAQRQKMMLLALQASLLVLRAGPSAPRGRFYVLAEPGLAALLFYGAARLLPRGLARMLTFSTYENMHSALKPYRFAQLIGTWTNNPARGLDQEYHLTRGYALDTFNDKASPELQVNVPPGLDHLIALAAAGRWKTIRQAHDMLGADATSFDQLGVVLDVIETTGRLQAGQASDDDLIRLTESHWGQDSLQLHAASVWPLVRASALRSETRRKQFHDLLWEHREELKGEVAEALAGMALEPWRERWDFYKKVVEDHGTPAANDFLSLLPGGNGNRPLPLAPVFRLPLLQEWYRLNQNSVLPPAIGSLLASTRDADLEALWRSALPPEWVNLAVMYTLLPGPHAAPTAVRLLRTADEARLGSFLQTLWGRTKDRDELREKVIVPLADKAAPAFLTRLFRAGLTGSPSFILNLLNSARVFEPEWGAYWRQEPSLELLFRSMKEHARETGPIWKWFTDQINDAVLSKGDADQRKLLERLEGARAALGADVPPEIDALIRDWVLVRKHFDPSYRGPRFPAKDLRRSCERLSLDPIALLRDDFEQFVLPLGDRGINRFEDTFHGFIPVESSFQNANTRLDAWLKVVKVCKDHDIRAGYQDYYLEKFIEPEHRLELATEAYKNGKIEKQALQKVRNLAAEAARAEEEARAALAVAAPAGLEDHPSMDPALARHLKGQRQHGPLLIIAAFAGVFLLLVGGSWWLLSRTFTTSEGEKNNQGGEKDKRVAIKDGRDERRDRDRKKDERESNPSLKYPKFDTGPVVTILNALLEEVKASAKEVDKLPPSTTKNELRDGEDGFVTIQTKLQTKKNEIENLPFLNDTTTPEGWEVATKTLAEIAGTVKSLEETCRNTQQKLYTELKKREARPLSVAEQRKMMEDWIRKAPPSVLAGLVESYAIEICGLDPMRVKDKMRPVMSLYIKAAGKAGQNANIDQMAVGAIKEALMAFAAPNVFEAGSTAELKPEEVKTAKKKLRETINELKPSFIKIALGNDKESMKNNWLPDVVKLLE